MLTLKQILKVANLLDQTGESRPGFLHDETDNLEGQNIGVKQGALTAPSALLPSDSRDLKTVIVSLDYEEDPTTGDVRIVQK